jgi:DNA-binding NarL/FixJ family response regulator
VSSGAGYLQAEVTRPVLERFSRSIPAPVQAHLSRRETDVIRLLAEGLPNKSIASHLGISEATVKGYLGQLFEKLGAADRAHAVALALRSRLID